MSINYLNEKKKKHSVSWPTFRLKWKENNFFPFFLHFNRRLWRVGKYFALMGNDADHRNTGESISHTVWLSFLFIFARVTALAPHYSLHNSSITTTLVFNLIDNSLLFPFFGLLFLSRDYPHFRRTLEYFRVVSNFTNYLNGEWMMGSRNSFPGHWPILGILCNNGYWGTTL